MRKNQQGFLLIVVLVLIVVIGVISALLVSLSSGSAEANINILRSEQALYIATSGLERAKRAIGVSGMNCAAINGSAQFTNVTFGGGEFTVTAVPSLVATVLNNNISSTVPTIPLQNVSGFSPNGGVVMVGNENISYNSIGGNDLIGSIRGVGGTMAVAHGIGTSVTQNQCIVSVVAGVPDLAVSLGRRTVRQVLTASGFSFFGASPALVSAAAIELRGTPAVINPSITFASDNYAGSTILSGGPVTLQGNASTRVNSESGLVESSNRTIKRADIMENVSAITAANLFGYFFNQPKVAIETGADVIFNANIGLVPLNGHDGQIVWVNGDVSDTGGATATVGNLLNPSILVIDGDLDLRGHANLNLFGLLYVTGQISMGGNTALGGQGTVAAEGQVELFGTSDLMFDPGIATRLSILHSDVHTGYVVTLTRPGEVFQ